MKGEHLIQVLEVTVYKGTVQERDGPRVFEGPERDTLKAARFDAQLWLAQQNDAKPQEEFHGRS